MISSKDLKKEIQNATGLKFRELSVKYGFTGHSDKFDIKVKVENFPLSKIKDIAEKYAHQDYCQASGEALMGGNTYVSVTYPWDQKMSEQFNTEICEVSKDALKYEVSNCNSVELMRYRHTKATEMLLSHLNENYEHDYTEADTREILSRSNFGELITKNQ